MKTRIITTALAMLLTTVGVFAQQKDTVDYYELTLQELMNMKVVSVSKKAETLFDAPLSASVLTREEIKNAGSTSIMEALRLIPGVIVREQANGVYDIHIRGLDNVPPNSLLLAATNTTTLVMINNRPVYNYLQGGTFWESLPIDLNDVDRIEVVRGPSSTLYGPNAVSGVINIITRRVEKDGVSVNGNAQFGALKTAIANTSVGYKVNNKLDIGLSGNYQSRGRNNIQYYDINNGVWVNSPNDLPIDNATERYPNPGKSMTKYGVNGFAHYTANENAQVNLTTGFQDSEVQGIMFDNFITSMSTSSTKSKYVDLQASTYGLNTQVSYTTAVQNPIEGMTGSKYDYKVIDASTEYEFNLKGLSIKPGITYRNAMYNDGAYWDIAGGEGIIGGKKTMETMSGGVRLEYKLFEDRLRLTGGFRMDKFSFPDKWFSSYQAAANYKINDKNLIRLVYSKAYRSPFIFDTYFNYRFLKPIGPGMTMEVVATGNKNLNLLSSDMIEMGYRSKLKSNVALDVEAYYTRTENYGAMIQGATEMTPEQYPIVATTAVAMENIPLQVTQMGTSISMTIVVDKFQIKPFVTFQKTMLENYSEYLSTATAAPMEENGFDPATNNVNSGIGTERAHKFTPKAYGGAQVNYGISSKFNLNLNTYWFSQQTFYQEDNLRFNDGIRGVGNINGKAVVNAKISYMPVKGFSVFVSGKNLLGKKSIEYYQGDATPRLVLCGVNFDF
jgi:iron complex outermembrane receptor protein